MMNTTMLSDLHVGTSGEVHALRRIQTHSFCIAFIVIFLRTGEKIQLEEHNYNPSEESSHTESDRPP